MKQMDNLVAALKQAFVSTEVGIDGRYLDLSVEGSVPHVVIDVDPVRGYGLHYKDLDIPGLHPDEVFELADLDKLIARLQELAAKGIPNAMELDNCQACFGASGGAKGNENRVEGLVLCDDCHTKATHGVLKSPPAPKSFEVAREHNEYVWANEKCQVEACPFCAGLVKG